MKPLQKAIALLLFALFLLPTWTLAEEGQPDTASVEQVVEGTVQAEGSTAKKAYTDDSLCRQIQDTYKAAKKRARRKSFKGYCGAYVANQLVVLGINTSYLSANGKNTYDIYRKMDRTTGGYDVSAYGAKKYTLMEALRAILSDDSAATNILVGFQRGTSSAGKKYGHVLFIHGIRDGKVYFSDSCARTVEDVRYKEGEPIVCSLTTFVDQYAKYKLDGVVHFEKASVQPSSSLETASGSSEKVQAQG